MPENEQDTNGDRVIGHAVRKWGAPALIAFVLGSGGGAGLLQLVQGGQSTQVDQISVIVNAKEIEHIESMLKTHIEDYRRDIESINERLELIRERLDWMSGYDSLSKGKRPGR